MQNIYEEETPASNVEEEQTEVNEYENVQKKKENRRRKNRLLTTVQVSACIAVLAALFLLRSFGGAAYQKTREWYLSAMNDSLVAEEQTEGIKKFMFSLWDRFAEDNSGSAASEPQSGSEAEQISSVQSRTASEEVPSSTQPVSDSVVSG